MSHDDVRREVASLRKSGKIDGVVERQANESPIEGAQLVRLQNIEDEQITQGAKLSKMDQALFGDDDLGLKGLVHDVRSLKITVFRSSAMVAGAIALGGALIAITTLFVEATKH